MNVFRWEVIGSKLENFELPVIMNAALFVPNSHPLVRTPPSYMLPSWEGEGLHKLPLRPVKPAYVFFHCH